MRFAILGSGAIGSYVGAALARGGSEVVLIARGPQLAALQANGVRVQSPRGDFEARVPATDDLEAVRDVDVVVIGLKAYSLPEHRAAPRRAARGRHGRVARAERRSLVVLPVVRRRTRGHGRAARRPRRRRLALDRPARVIGCVTYPATELVEPGVVRHVEGTRFAIGEPDGSASERCRAVADAFTAGGLKCPIEAQVREQLWLKLVGNVAFNPTTTVTGALLGELALAPEPTALARGLMEECAGVGDALGITMPVSIDRRLEAGIAVGDHRTSMLQDFENGKPLEIDCLTGAVIEIAELLGLEVPQTRAIDAVVRLKTILRDRASTHGGAPATPSPEPAPVR